MSITTGGGDQGDSGLLGGDRVPKDDLRLEAYGTLDELNAVLGVTLADDLPQRVEQEIQQISHWLFELGTDLATPGAGLERGPAERLSTSQVDTLTDWIHAHESELPKLTAFILPGGTTAAANLHLARTVCRRAERRVVSHFRRCGEGRVGMVFLNRLSDLLFLHARLTNHAQGQGDVEWKSQG